VFEAHRPPVRERHIDAAANVPARSPATLPLDNGRGDGRQRLVVRLLREPCAGISAGHIGHPFAHRPAGSSADAEDVVETRHAVEQGNGLLGTQVYAGVVLERRREASLHAENDLAELMLQADLAADDRGTVADTEALPRYADDGGGWVAVREGCIDLRPGLSRVDAKIEPAPVRRPFIDDPAFGLITVGLR